MCKLVMLHVHDHHSISHYIISMNTHWSGRGMYNYISIKKKKNHHQHPFIMELLSWLGTCLKVSRTASSVANHESLGHVKWSYLTGSLMCAMLSWSLTPCRLTLSGTNFHFLSPVGMDPDTLLSDSNQCQTPITLAKIFEVKMKVSLWSRNQ